MRMAPRQQKASFWISWKSCRLRLNGDKSIKVAFDNDVSWPLTWYLRDYPQRVFFRRESQPKPERFAGHHCGGTELEQRRALSG